MATPACHETKAVPDPGALAALPMETKADPCPMRFGHPSIHIIQLTNRRPYSIYRIDFISKALFAQIELANGTSEWIHYEPVITRGFTYVNNHPMTAQAGAQGNTDEIQWIVKLYDATQQNGPGFSGPKAITDLTYSILIQ